MSEEINKLLDENPREEVDSLALTPDEVSSLSQNQDRNDDVLEGLQETPSQIDRTEKRAEHSLRLQEEDTVYVTIGRMNPPTAGHRELIKHMVKNALFSGLTQVNIVLSSTLDTTKNILEDEEKRGIIYEMISHPSFGQEILAEMHGEYAENQENIKEIFGLTNFPSVIEICQDFNRAIYYDKFRVEVICMADPTVPSLGTNPITKSLKYILGLYQNPLDGTTSVQQVKLIVGQDRAVDFGWIKNSFPGLPFSIDALPRPESAISATEVRGYIADGDEANYRRVMGPMNLREETLARIRGQISAYLQKGGKRKSSIKNRYKTKRLRNRYGKKSRRKGKSRRKRRHRHYMSAL